MKGFNYFGRASYYLLWPGISLYLLGNQRSRIVVFSREDVLVVKGWLSNGKWSLPGGGLHASEPMVTGALRELYEETGLLLKTSDIKELISENFRLRGVKVKLHFFSAAVNSNLPVKKQPREITDIAWINQKELNPNNTNKDALRGIAIWKST
jgi:8-oxo-dGTP pyrophosphatase MutT (NUDIX family)